MVKGCIANSNISLLFDKERKFCCNDFLRLSNIWGFCSRLTVDQPTANQSTMDNEVRSVAVAVGVVTSDRLQLKRDT